MGKIRVKSFDEEQSAEEQNKKQEKKEAKKAAKGATKTQTQSANVAPDLSENAPVIAPIEAESSKKEKKAKFKKAAKVKSPRYLSNAALFKKDRPYTLPSALELLKKFNTSNFDETVELHVNLKEKGFSGSVDLPHGTGKKRRIKIADEALISQVEKGVIDFDVLVAHPTLMPKLAKVARILGPRGLMPNPKAGTISTKPEETVEKLSAGQLNFKTEASAPIVHLSVGKVSFSDKQLEENVKSIYSALPDNKVVSMTIKSTMSPGIKIDLASFAKGAK